MLPINVCKKSYSTSSSQAPLNNLVELWINLLLNINSRNEIDFFLLCEKKGSIRTIERTYLSYVEPHKIIIKGTTFLAFNYSNEIYIKNLSQKIKLLELEDYLKSI